MNKFTSVFHTGGEAAVGADSSRPPPIYRPRRDYLIILFISIIQGSPSLTDGFPVSTRLAHTSFHHDHSKRFHVELAESASISTPIIWPRVKEGNAHSATFRWKHLGSQSAIYDGQHEQPDLTVQGSSEDLIHIFWADANSASNYMQVVIKVQGSIEPSPYNMIPRLSPIQLLRLDNSADQDNPGEISAIQVSAGKVSLAKMRFTQVRTFKIGTTQIGLVEVSFG